MGVVDAEDVRRGLAAEMAVVEDVGVRGKRIERVPL